MLTVANYVFGRTIKVSLGLMLAFMMPGCGQHDATVQPIHTPEDMSATDAAACTSAHGRLCGLPSMEAPASKPTFVCREGALVLEPTRVERTRTSERGQHERHNLYSEQSFNITTSLPATCITLVRGDTASMARVFVDSREAIGPHDFAQALVVEKPLSLKPGTHTLRVRLSSGPGGYVDISMRHGGDLRPEGLVHNHEVGLFGVFGAPAPYSPSLGTSLSLSAQGTVLAAPASYEKDGKAHVGWQWEVREAQSCKVVRTIEGEQDVSPPWIFSIESEWDGQSDSGALVKDGLYAYRLQAWLVHERGRGYSHNHRPYGRAVIVSTALQKVVVDGTPPVLTVESPQAYEIVHIPELMVSGEVRDVYGIASVTINDSLIGIDGGWFAGGPYVLHEGVNTFAIVASDRAGNSTTANVPVAYVSPEAVGVFVMPGSGGRLEVSDSQSPIFGSFVEVPAGAVREVTFVSMTPAIAGAERPGMAVSGAVHFASSNPFVSAVTVGIGYDEGAVAFVGGQEGAVEIVVRHEGEATWQRVHDSSVDVSRHVVSSQVAGFSVMQAIVDGTSSSLAIERLPLSEFPPPITGNSTARLKSASIDIQGDIRPLVRQTDNEQDRALIARIRADEWRVVDLSTSTPLAQEMVSITEQANVSAPEGLSGRVAHIASGSRENITVFSHCDEATAGQGCAGVSCRCRLVVLDTGEGW